MKKRHAAWLAGILVLVALTARGALSNGGDLLSQLRTLTRIYAIIEANYVEEVDAQKLFEGAFRGMAQSLGDPHTTYFDAEQNERFASDTEGEFGGLGIEIGMEDGILTVVSPIPGTPAYEAGVLAGDRIVAIEGESTEGIYLQEAVRRLRGKPGSKVTITVRQPDARMSRNIEITRDVIKPASLEKSMLDPDQKIAYIHLFHFTSALGDEFDQTLEEFAEQGMRGLILDLRGNPGGLLPMAVRVADKFIAEGTLVSVRGRRPEEKAVYRARERGTITDLPIVVLVDRGSASGSEIVAGALRDHRRAILVGDRTFGKGSVQKLFPIPPDGAGSLKLTTARYYTPNDHPVEARRGIEPHISIPMTAEQMLELRMQEREDKMRGQHVPGRSNLRWNAERERPAEGEEGEEAEEGEREKPAERRERAEDIQLRGALKVLEIQMMSATAAR